MLGAGQTQALRLSAAKSSMGHAEPAAGGIGIAHVMCMMPQHLTVGLTHLRNINPIILGASNMEVHERLSLPKQSAPFVSLKRTMRNEEGVYGISSFAFQGTNAHIVLSMNDLGRGEFAPQHLQKHALWMLQRHWYVGPSHQLLSTVACTGTEVQCILEAATSQAPLGKVLQYERVGGPTFVMSLPITLEEDCADIGIARYASFLLQVI